MRRIPGMFFLLFVSCAIVAGQENCLRAEAALPHEREVRAIMADLTYSAIPIVMRPDVVMRVDFKKAQWRLAMFHRFDADGKPVLDEGRYGLCGELAVACLEKVRPLFGDAYTIRFVRVREAGYFLRPGITHIVLVIKDRTRAGPTYVIDPSLKVYGELDDLREYFFFGTLDHLPFVSNRETDILFAADTGMPITIANGYLVGLVVERLNDLFDPDNFSIVLSVTEKNKFTGRNIYVVRVRQGRAESFEDRQLARTVLSDEEYEKLRKRIDEWFARVYTDAHQNR